MGAQNDAIPSVNFKNLSLKTINKILNLKILLYLVLTSAAHILKIWLYLYKFISFLSCIATDLLIVQEFQLFLNICDKRNI